MRIPRPARLIVIAAVLATAVSLTAPDGANAGRCFLLFECPPVASPPAAPGAPDSTSPLPVPPSPIPVPPAGPPVPAPPGNPGCEPRPRRTSGWLVGAGDVVSASARDRRCTLATMAASGVRIVRSSFLWSQIERAPRQFDFAFYDRYVEQLARYRMRVLPVLFGTPGRYSVAPKSRYPDRVQPRSGVTFGRFAAAVARRYGPKGSFWRQHPSVPRLPIRSWQIWNEPNVSFFWSPRPSARRYSQMLAVASRAIKRVDRKAEIVAGGLAESRFGISISKYLRALYRNRGARWFDTVALHTYSRSAGSGVAIVERTRALMNRHGDRRARIWVTEFGWATGGPAHGFKTSERGQAARVRQTLRTIYRRRARLRARGAIYSFWSDPPPYRSDFWGLHVGLHRRDGRPKPAARAFRQVASRLR